MELWKLYKIIEAKAWCKGVENTIVMYLGKRDVTPILKYDGGLCSPCNNVCLVRIIKPLGYPCYPDPDELWIINEDCVYKEVLINED